MCISGRDFDINVLKETLCENTSDASLPLYDAVNISHPIFSVLVPSGQEKITVKKKKMKKIKNISIYI